MATDTWRADRDGPVETRELARLVDDGYDAADRVIRETFRDAGPGVGHAHARDAERRGVVLRGHAIRELAHAVDAARAVIREAEEAHPGIAAATLYHRHPDRLGPEARALLASIDKADPERWVERLAGDAEAGLIPAPQAQYLALVALQRLHSAAAASVPLIPSVRPAMRATVDVMTARLDDLARGVFTLSVEPDDDHEPGDEPGDAERGT